MVRQIDLPTGDIARVYAEPLLSDDEVIAFHRHQLIDVETSAMH